MASRVIIRKPNLSRDDDGADNGRLPPIFLDKRRFSERSARQEERIYELEQLSFRTASQTAELRGLKQKSFVEQYDPSTFSTSHVQFKDQHNQIFQQLCHYCGCCANTSAASDTTGNTARNVFYLDGADAKTTSALKAANVPIECMYVANRHASTCDKLLEHGLLHVEHASAEQALSTDGGAFSNISFAAYYLDGCGGHAPILIDTLRAALQTAPLPHRGSTSPALTLSSLTRRIIIPPICIGISIVGGNRNVVDKELVIAQALVKLAKTHGLRVEHVLDDCERYNVSSVGVGGVPNKVEGNTMTTWFLLLEDTRGDE